MNGMPAATSNTPTTFASLPSLADCQTLHTATTATATAPTSKTRTACLFCALPLEYDYDPCTPLLAECEKQQTKPLTNKLYG
ncbi:hypothetical protein BaRGS_00018311 [Batillaria attramentaria]|uniref:Uncharacterized protein n=1 Tax=Batillaria attramentaria TaxID=370345 RepID=A0ABD0KUM1_9CAEN